MYAENASMKTKRPIIITLLSVFLVFVCGGTVLVLLFGNFPKESVDYLLSQRRLTGFVGRHYGVVGLKAELAPLCLLLVITGVGLWRLLPWARTAIMVVSCLEICSEIEQIVEIHLTRSSGFVDLTSAFAGALLLLYFSRKKIKHIFRPALANAAPAV